MLVDFCTYTCINWLRTLPYIRAWAEKYRQGLVVIGVHTPEFAFERNLDNVRRALGQMRIDYPIAIDSDYAIWRAFDNHYWPALYFVDARGRVREHHFGEGEYERSEKIIQRLLTDAGVAGVASGVVSVEATGVEAAGGLGQPEIAGELRRLRSHRAVRVAWRRQIGQAPGVRVPARLRLNEWALAGEWMMGRQAIILTGPNGRLACRFQARDLHLVMGPPRRESPVRIRVSLDGRPPGPAHGLDVDEDGYGTAVDQRLYQLIRQSKPIVDRHFEIEFLDPGVEAFAFTFG